MKNTILPVFPSAVKISEMIKKRQNLHKNHFNSKIIVETVITVSATCTIYCLFADSCLSLTGRELENPFSIPIDGLFRIRIQIVVPGDRTNITPLTFQDKGKAGNLTRRFPALKMKIPVLCFYSVNKEMPLNILCSLYSSKGRYSAIVNPTTSVCPIMS